jgi:hypothetical protein
MIDVHKTNGSSSLLDGVSGRRFVSGGIVKKMRNKCVLVDQDLDPYPVQYLENATIEIGTEGSSYLSLSVDDLYALIDWIEARQESIGR